MVENYTLAKEIVSLKYPQEHEWFPLFVLALTTLLNHYPDYKDNVKDIFLRTDIIIENDSILSIMEKHKITLANFTEEEKDSELSENDTFGISSRGDSYYFDNDGELQIEENNPFLICSTKVCNPTVLLNVFIHEMNHLIKGSVRGMEIDTEEGFRGYYVRSGINFYHCKYEVATDTLYEYDYYNTLDEVINVLEVTSMVKNILMLDGIIPDTRIQEYINSLDKKIMQEDFSYDSCVELMRPLWANPVFYSLIEDNIFLGDLDEIIPRFDEIAGKGSFEDMADALDEIFQLLVNKIKGEELENCKDFLKDIIKRFNKKTNFAYHK